jgi:acetyl esterase/lipase
VCSGRTTVLVLAGPGELPDGCRVSAEHHARRLGLDLRWQDVQTAADLAELVLNEGPRHDAVVLASGEHASSVALAEAVRELAAGEGGPPRVVHADTAALDHLDVVHRASDAVLHGRHRRVFHDALAHVRAERERPPRPFAYGDDPAQVADLRLPDASAGPGRAPVIVLVHGGFWLDPYRRDLMGPLAVALTDEGWATWNVGYRRRGPSGGGWPATLEDVCAAVDALVDLADEVPIDPERLVMVGHSAGAQLAAYAAARRHLPDDAPGLVPRPIPIASVSLAGVLDLEAAAAEGLGGDAAVGFLGDPADHPDRYRLASPIRLVPFGIPHLAVHGADDTFVPATQTRRFVEVARASGDEVATSYPEVHHLDIVAPDGPAFDTLRRWLRDLRNGR